MYDFIETATGWIVYWGPAPQLAAKDEPRVVDAKRLGSEVKPEQPAVMGWELYGI